MKKFVSWIVLLIIGAVALLFSVSNRAAVSVDLWPLPIVQDVPLFITVIGAAIFGFLGGGMVTWFSSGHVRKRARAARRQVSSMEKDLTTLRDRIADLEEHQAPPKPLVADQ
ncbi:MAG: lipopolysaccharide assembly protein LapA domain-containing protein [Proteobacteria bacterium]|nr:lipopolysaccharide assembly protein LapA domain-containing protein [Pseudomonadota bacterium]